MKHAFLLVLLLSFATRHSEADYPEFCEHAVCSLRIAADSVPQRRLYVHIPYNPSRMHAEVQVQSALGTAATRGLPIEAYVPLQYTYGPAGKGFFVLNASTQANFAAFPTLAVNKSANLYPYFPVAEYPLLNATNTHRPSPTIGYIPSDDQTYSWSVDIHPPHAFEDGFNILFKIGTPPRVTALELIAMPMLQFKTHGYWWTKQQYFYIFAATNAAIAVAYATVARCRIWQWALVFACAAFVSTGETLLYHACIASIRGGDTGQQVYAIACIAILANLVPAAFSLFFMRFGKCQPVTWSVLSIGVGTGFLFLAGSGWFVGPGLLIVAGLARMLQRAFPTRIA